MKPRSTPVNRISVQDYRGDPASRFAFYRRLGNRPAVGKIIYQLGNRRLLVVVYVAVVYPAVGTGVQAREVRTMV